MKKTVLAIVIAAVVMYFWGFLYWGLGPYRTQIWRQAKDDAVAGELLLDQFPQRGTYYVPGFQHDQATTERLFKQGPVAMVYMLAPRGRPVLEPSIMVQGFVLNLVVLVLLSLMLHQVAVALPTYADRARFVALSGLAASVLIDCGEAVWWQIPWSWKLYQAGYSISVWLIAGLILAWFIPPRDGSSERH